MLDIMYEIPSKGNVSECLINDEVIAKGEGAILVYEKEAEVA